MYNLTQTNHVPVMTAPDFFLCTSAEARKDKTEI